MEKQTVFIKVPINEGHIGELDVYITPDGKRVWGQVYLDQSTCLWQCYEPKTDNVWYVTHALEEIELPSEKEVKEELTHPANISENVSTLLRDMYEHGLNRTYSFILNHLKSNTNGNQHR